MQTFRPSYFMLVPTMACQASCRYCFARKQGDIMTRETFLKAVDFMERTAPRGEKIHVVFHGGEPLLAGTDFYEAALPLLKKRFGARLSLSIQSNLWALNGPEGDRLAELLFLYDVSVGTSIDGYREMCDSQRGEGYYDRTMAAVKKLQGYGIPAGKICTFGRENADKARRVFEEAEGSYALHGAVPSLAGGCTGEDPLTLAPEEMTRVFLDSYEAYRKDPAHARISTIDAMARSCLRGESGLCTFRVCLGRFAAIGPGGDIYSCQRFTGCEGFSLGNVKDDPTEETILKSPAFLRLKEKQEGMKEACGDCSHFSYCRGGCLYSSFAGGGDRDPYCSSYKEVFGRIRRDMALEMAERMRGQLTGEEEKDTPLLSMAGDRPHPYDRRMALERFREAAELGKKRGDLTAAVKKLKEEDLFIYGRNRINGLFLNITYRCPLRCTHCSANTGSVESKELSPQRFAGIAREAAAAGFREIEFTGGEPFVYPGFDQLMEMLAEVDRRGTRFVLRTSFGYDIPPERIRAACRLFDKVIVSMDGDEAFHDQRRGKGVYKKALENLRLAMETPGRRCSFGLWAVLSAKERRGKEGNAVRALAEELGIREVTFRPLLPLGRGCGARMETLEDIEVRIPRAFRLRHTCGIGSNMTAEPNGDVYPCYAWCAEGKRLGNLGTEDMETVLGRGTLFRYRLHDVDSNEKCSGCDVRYLCGGMCRSWVRDKQNPDSGDFICDKYRYYKRMASLAEKPAEG